MSNPLIRNPFDSKLSAEILTVKEVYPSDTRVHERAGVSSSNHPFTLPPTQNLKPAGRSTP